MANHLACIVLLFLLAVSSSTSASPDAPVIPLSAVEQRAVIAEIDAMIATDESAVSTFVVREATPERMDRLYQMPELKTLDRTRRENGLIFAGHGALLSFDKPSDVLRKVSTWFPNEIAAARAAGDNRLFGYINLWGPYPNWGDEQTAFLTLWNCMPQIAWISPTENPFMRRLNDGLPFMAIAAKDSSELDFRHCVYKRSGQRPAWTQENIPAIEKEVHDMGRRVAPVIQRKFAQFLASNRCQGTGPDDCVLILLLWASLSPNDPELASALQLLEAEVAPTEMLPELKLPAHQYGSGTQEGEQRFDEGLRKAAFMRAKLLSLFNAPSAWPAQALATSVHQMTRLQKMLNAAIDYRWHEYELDYYNEPVNPWTLFSEAVSQTDQVRNAILAELTMLGDDTPCEIYHQWYKHGGAAPHTTYVLQQLQSQRSLRCASPDWAWLKQADSPQALNLRNGFLALLGHINSAEQQDMLLSSLTDNGAACFSVNTATPDWLQPICAAWINEPQIVQTQLAHSQLTLSEKEKFQSTQLSLVSEISAYQSQGISQESWLDSLVTNAKQAVREKMQIVAAELSNHGLAIYAAKLWTHPGHNTSLIELQLTTAENLSETPWPYANSRLLIAIDRSDMTLVGIPARFFYQYDEGDIFQVSDLDEDNYLEVWLSGTFGECDGEELQPGTDCANETLHMGEIRGDVLSYFINTPTQSLQLLILGLIIGLVLFVLLIRAAVTGVDKNDQRP